MIRVNPGGYIAGGCVVGIEQGKMASAAGLTAKKLLKGQSCLGISGTATEDATGTAGDIYVGKTAYINGNKITGTMPNLNNSATIQHTSNNATKVILGDAAYVTTNSDNKTRAQIRYNGTVGYLSGNTLIGIDQETMAAAGGLTAGKILQGNSAFGISGTATNDATAAAGDILTGKIGYVKGSKITGTMANQGAKTSSLNCGGSYTIPAGYHNGSGKVTANSLASQTGVQSGKTAVTANRMVSGYEGWVNGNRITGTMPSYGAWPKASGVSWDTTNKYVTLHMAPGAYINETSSNSGFFGAQAGYVDKTVTPTKSAQTVTPDSGKVLHNVTVNAIPNDYLYRDRTTSVTFTSIPIGQSKTFSVSVNSNTTDSITHFILKNSNGNSFIYLPGPSMAEFTFTYLSNTIKIKGDRSTDKTKCNYTFTNVSGPSAIEVRKMYTYRD